MPPPVQSPVSVTVLPPAVWAPPARESSAAAPPAEPLPKGPPQGVPQGLSHGPPHGSATPQGMHAVPLPEPLPQGTAQGLPHGSPPPPPPILRGTQVVLQGLANQPAFN